MNFYFNKDQFTFNEDICFENVKIRCVCQSFRNIISLKDRSPSCGYYAEVCDSIFLRVFWAQP